MPAYVLQQLTSRNNKECVKNKASRISRNMFRLVPAHIQAQMPDYAVTSIIIITVYVYVY